MTATQIISRVESTIREAKADLKEVEQELEQMKKIRRRSNVELTNGQAAAMLEVSTRTIQRMKEDGRLENLNVLTILNYRRKQ